MPQPRQRPTSQSARSKRTTSAPKQPAPKRAAPKRAKHATADSARRKPKAQSIDDYLDGVSAAQRPVLERLRRVIRAVAPAAEECISYGLAAFRLDGKLLVGFGATKAHCAFYPLSGSTIAAHQRQLRSFKTSKGSIQFSPEQPLAPSLVKLLGRARIAENRR
ncbi:MAG: DUF1801 domain-containing protein [Myxococcales bacterium]